MARHPTVRRHICEAKNGKIKQVSYRAHSKRSNGSTHTLYTRYITICPKQQLGILQASKQHATVPQYENKRNGHDVQVKHNKT